MTAFPDGRVTAQRLAELARVCLDASGGVNYARIARANGLEDA